MSETPLVSAAPLQLHALQEIGADFLAGRDRAMLLDGMRVGKTPQALLGAVRRGAKKVGIACAAIARTNLRQKAALWTPGLEVMVESYDRLTVNQGARTAMQKFRPDVLIVDEAQYARTRTAKRTKMLYGPRCNGTGGLIESAGAVWPLSGTLTPTNAGDAWPHLHALFGMDLGYWDFVKRYCKLIETPFGTKIGDLRPEHAAELIAFMKPHYLRRKFAEVWGAGGLPIINEEVFDLPDAVAALKRVDHDAELRRLTGLAKVDPVIEFTENLIANGARKVVVFAWHHEVIEGIARHFRHAYDPEQTRVIYGPTTQAGRDEAMRSFQDPASPVRILVGQIQTLGTSIELSEAQHAVFAEFDWNPANIVQAMYRLVHADKPRPVDVAICSIAGSHDEKVTRAAVQHAKTNNTLFN